MVDGEKGFQEYLFESASGATTTWSDFKNAKADILEASY